MDVIQVGIDHHLAPIEIRERISLDAAGVAQVARAVHALPWVNEALILSTCNRTELYVVSPLSGASDLALSAFLEHLPYAPDPEQVGYRQQTGEAAAQHLLRVASGLESAILGETEIQGQVKEAHARSRAHGTAGPVLDRLCQASLRTGKRARTETGISLGGVSHGSAAVDVVGRIFDSLEGRTVLVVGAGTIASQAARAFAAVDGVKFVIANRTPEHAEALSAELPDSEVVSLVDMPGALQHAHVAVFATGGAPLGVDVVEGALSKRRDPLLLVDMGLPRSIDTAAARLPGVFLYDLEDLEQLVAGALAARREAVPGVESIVHDEFDRYRAWYRTLATLPTIRSLNAWADGIRQEELTHAGGLWPDEVRESVDALTRRLVRRLLGRPTQRVVKGAEGEDPNLPTAEHLKHVFGLDEETAARREPDDEEPR